ncbi:MAG: NINE protein [Cyanobacteria bacterium]|jgi:TM2 domain-containing membrane protein YozV|nr:NINE protein [Cyanobacteria bacterium GSL.Bin1]
MFLAQEKSQKLAVMLAMVSAITPLSGLHKFYLGQPWWGLTYLLLSVILTPPMTEMGILSFFGLAQVASLLEGIWYFMQSEDRFQQRFNQHVASSFRSDGQQNFSPNLVEETANAIQRLDQLREEGLLSEYEFEKQRRQLVNRINK